MRNLLALVGLFVVGFAGIGWYCGWYKLSVGRATDGNLQIDTEVQTKKVVEDSSSFFQKLGKMATDKANQDGQPTTAPVSTPGPGVAAPPPPAPTKDNSLSGWLLSPQKPAQPTANR
ncbi:MAG: hypothetical protein K8U57_26885 [Planctomycetes bacterium]|nr:hypothetical protein [Planctomycetota bacterium]